MEKMTKLKELVELAMEVEDSDPIDWSIVQVDPETVYGMMAAHVIDMFEEEKEDAELIMMGVMVKLLVENFVLQAYFAQDSD